MIVIGQFARRPFPFGQCNNKLQYFMESSKRETQIWPVQALKLFPSANVWVLETNETRG